MNDIPEVVEQLYYNWVTIPEPEKWAGYIGKNPVLAQGLYSFYSGPVPWHEPLRRPPGVGAPAHPGASKMTAASPPRSPGG